jgi:hypothetical protein
MSKMGEQEITEWIAFYAIEKERFDESVKRNT